MDDLSVLGELWILAEQFQIDGLKTNAMGRISYICRTYKYEQ